VSLKNGDGAVTRPWGDIGSSPIMTPWGDYNVRLQDPDGMQITLFQNPDTKEQGK